MCLGEQTKDREQEVEKEMREILTKSCKTMEHMKHWLVVDSRGIYLENCNHYFV